jgi:hypothetical protein
MTRRAPQIVGLAMLGIASILHAQEGAGVRHVRELNERLQYDSAVVAAESALATPRVSPDDRLALYELLGNMYAAMDSTTRAGVAFENLIQMDPDRAPDPLLVSPKIVNLYNAALGRVLVARHVMVDSASFVAGEGHATIRFQVTRAAAVRTRLVGGGLDIMVDSLPRASADLSVQWNGLTPAGAPIPPGRYQVIVTASAGGNASDNGRTWLAVSATPRDTVALLTALPDYQEQPETEQPGRSWAPLSAAASYFSVGLAAALVLRNTAFGSALPAGLIVVGSASLASGFVLSLRSPPPRPVESAVLYNRLLRDMLVRRNVEIANANANRRRQVVLTVVQSRPSER